jgi:predicted amidohydrolase
MAPRSFNTHVVLDAAGSTAATYRKVHLFDVDVPSGPVLMESRTTAPGDKVCVCVCTTCVAVGCVAHGRVCMPAAAHIVRTQRPTGVFCAPALRPARVAPRNSWWPATALQAGWGSPCAMTCASRRCVTVVLQRLQRATPVACRRVSRSK